MNDNALYIIPDSVIFNPDPVVPFINFKSDDTITLNATLYLNLVRNFIDTKKGIDLFCLFDREDEKFLPEEFISRKLNILFCETADHKQLYDNLSEKKFSRYKNNIIVNSRVIGLNYAEMDRLFNLLNIEDESLIVGKSLSGQIGLLGFNNYSEEVFGDLAKSGYYFEDFLYRINPVSYFLHTINDILIIRDLESFKRLYSELSQKKSIEYCDQEMHERFTNLFIEYRDLIK